MNARSNLWIYLPVLLGGLALAVWFAFLHPPRSAGKAGAPQERPEITQDASASLTHETRKKKTSKKGGSSTSRLASSSENPKESITAPLSRLREALGVSDTSSATPWRDAVANNPLLRALAKIKDPADIRLLSVADSKLLAEFLDSSAFDDACQAVVDASKIRDWSSFYDQNAANTYQGAVPHNPDYVDALRLMRGLLFFKQDAAGEKGDLAGSIESTSAALAVINACRDEPYALIQRDRIEWEQSMLRNGFLTDPDNSGRLIADPTVAERLKTGGDYAAYFDSVERDIIASFDKASFQQRGTQLTPEQIQASRQVVEEFLPKFKELAQEVAKNEGGSSSVQKVRALMDEFNKRRGETPLAGVYIDCISNVLTFIDSAYAERKSRLKTPLE